MSAKKEPFSIAGKIDLEKWSNLDTQAPTIELIDIDLIESNEANFYEMSNLQPLADSILMDGLQQPLVVTTSPDDSTKVRLLSGHRRRAAIQMLIDDAETPHPELRRVPCIRKAYTSTAMAELQLILANSTARELTAAEKMKQAEKIEMLLYKLKEEGYSFPGRMRDQVAAACNASASKLARLKVIRDKLEPEFMKVFEENKLSEDAAYHIAKGIDLDGQRSIIARRCEGKSPLGLEIPANVVEHIADGLDKLAKTPIRDCPAGGKCTAYSARERIIVKAKNSWDHFCTGCCIDCYSREHCSNVCPTGKAKVKLANERRLKQQEKQQKEIEARNVEYAKKNRAFAEKLLAVTGDTEEGRKKLGQINWQWAESRLSDALGGKSTSYGFCNPAISDALKFADEFGVSLDYIYGRSDEPKLYKGEWMRPSDALPKNGEFVLIIKKYTDVIEQAVYFRNDFMDATDKSTANNCFKDVVYWAYPPALPDGRTFPGQETLREILKGT